MNKENLLKHADFLDTLPVEKFDMNSFARDEHDQLDLVVHECMTVGCAVGWGPAAGFPVIKADANDWFEYSHRVFGISLHHDSWNWCFHGGWTAVDNTPTGAAKRIRHLVEHGIPPDYQDQLTGDARYLFA